MVFVIIIIIIIISRKPYFLLPLSYCKVFVDLSKTLDKSILSTQFNIIAIEIFGKKIYCDV